MAATMYDTALRRLLAHEGGYTNHPDDPGGPTNFGITIADYRRCVKPDATADDVRAMPLGEAESIYRRRYWDAQRCDDLPAGIDYAVFDYGVNSGVGRSAKVLRRVLRLADTSSKVTDEVVAAARAGDACEIVAAICDERLRFLKSLKTWDVFGKGWERRVTEVKFAALAMAQPRAAASAAPAKAGGAIVAAGGVAATAHQANLPPFVVLAIAAAAAVAAAIVVHFVTRQKG